MYESRTDAPDWTDSKDSFLWPDSTRGPWMVRVEWARVEGRFECVGLAIRSYRDTYSDGTEWPMELPERHATAATMSASLLRRLPVGEVLTDLRRQSAGEFSRLAFAFESDEDDDAKVMAAGMRHHASEWVEPRDALVTHQEVARVYTEAWRSDAAAPTRAVADHFVISASAAAKRVARAREAGFLPPTRQGRAQGTTDRTTATQEGAS